LPRRQRSSHIGSAWRAGTALGYDIDAGTSGLVIWFVMLDANGRLYRVPADRANCKGKTFLVPTLFTRAGPEMEARRWPWLLGRRRPVPAQMDGRHRGRHRNICRQA